MSKLKAYIFSPSPAWDTWCALVHGETPGKAKVAGMYIDFVDWEDIRVVRAQELDGIPFSYENTAHLRIIVDEYGEMLTRAMWVNYCRCEICSNDRKE